ncbi:substrate-binding periplasmic protein [Vibrio ouci]|uniref:Transporter substrate-binding domain-containing protein n=1 Tax=Vibrio ouci TaxID=2499078 RepID=A0A4Y8WDL4_9VIBR|nr:transporter substrate-binding domain-containing protein [Vibrio ouci]TFH90468.1 transporter substrate-binding domain-containing protein [Vibrio ouci]
MFTRALILFTLLVLPAHAQMPVNVVWTIQDEWPPYVIDSGNKKGLAHDIISEAFAVQGYQIKNTIKPWSRALREVMTQRFDIALTVWKSSERLVFLSFSDPYLTNSLVFVTLKGNSFDYSGLSSLNDKRIGVLRGYAYDDSFLQAENFDRMESDSLATNVRKLKAKRIDALIADKIFFRWYIKTNQMDINDFEFVAQPLAVNPLHIAISRDHPKREEILSAFNAGLKALQQSGRIAELIEQYQ